MGFPMEPSSHMKVLMLDGALTIERANELKEMLLDALRENEHVALNLEKVTAVDLACLQVLCAAHRTSVGSNRHLTLQGKRPEVLERIMVDAGYARSAGCRGDSDRNCLWIGGSR